MPKKKEWIVKGNVEFSGAIAFVMASSEKEALTKARQRCCLIAQEKELRPVNAE